MADYNIKIYNLSPIWIQNILTTVQGNIYRKQRFGSFYHSYLKELKERDYSNITAQRQYQDQEFVRLLHYAVKNSPFYKEYYNSCDLKSIKGVKDIGKLPILTKETVRSNIDNLYTINPTDGVISNTSGTTGTSMKFIYTNEDLQKRMAYLDHFKAQHGFIANKMKRASFNSSKIIPTNQKSNIFWRDNWSIKQRIYSGYHCKDKNLPFYVKNLNRYQPESIDGYPSALYEISRFIIENKIGLSFTPIAIFPTAETLLPHYKKTIEEAFGCPVRDQYASSEGAPFITECEFGKLHYNLDTGIIEVDKDGEMLVTCFQTYGTPLIRYRIGDRVVMDEVNKICECGSSHPIVRGIEGRGIDYLVSKSKGRFTAIYLSLVSEDFLNSVKRMQFIQNSVDEIQVLLEVDKTYKKEMNQIILNKLQYSFGNDMKFNLQLVHEIPRESSGKYRLIINNMDKK
ncbi:phenylacetate--CoA ligase family protein [Peribacillus frigoritolerans]|uniref:phenylacetate--CoA ligase family protein n=1 Tax=Peribacillus frigoritolerans TaxID=450367 RepID=UPI003D290429